MPVFTVGQRVTYTRSWVRYGPVQPERDTPGTVLEVDGTLVCVRWDWEPPDAVGFWVRSDMIRPGS